MENIYWTLLIIGVLFALVTIIFDDIIGNLLDGVLDFLSALGLDFMEPMVLVGGLTTLGGAGVMLTRYTALNPISIFIVSFMIATLLMMVVYFAYVKPMKNTENSTAFSNKDLIGKVGEVMVPIPAKGYGEIILKIGAGNTNQIAASFDSVDIPAETKIVIVEITEVTFYVVPLDID